MYCSFRVYSIPTSWFWKFYKLQLLCRVTSALTSSFAPASRFYSRRDTTWLLCPAPYESKSKLGSCYRIRKSIIHKISPGPFVFVVLLRSNLYPYSSHQLLSPFPWYCPSPPAVSTRASVHRNASSSSAH